MIYVHTAITAMREGELCDIEVIAKDGRRLSYDNVRLIKYYHRGATLKVKFEASGEIREFKLYQLVSYNQEDVIL